MQDTKLFMLLRSIDKKNYSKLLNFLKSPYFNKSEKILELIKYILNYAPNYEAKQLSKEVIFKAMFPKEKFEDVKLRRLNSKALKLVEQFILQIQMEEDELTQHHLMTKYYATHELDYFFKSRIKSWEGLIKKQSGKIYFFENYIMASQKAEYHNKLFFKKMYKNTKKGIEDEVVNVIDALHSFYLFEMLSFNCFLSQLYSTFNKKIEMSLLKHFMDYCTEEDIQRHPIISLYYQSVLLLQNREEKDYLKLKEVIQDFEINEWNKYILMNMYKILENYAIKKMGEGESRYGQELLELYKYEIEQKLVFENGYFFPVKFRNITIIGLRVGENEWVENFIQKYYQTLPINQLPELYHYCLGLVYLKQRRYQEITDMLMTTSEGKDAFVMFDIKRLQLMMYYETDEIDLLDSMMNAFRVLVFRDKFLSQGPKEANQNFINMLYRLVRFQPNDQTKIENMEEELKSSKLFCNQEWLLEKVQELAPKQRQKSR